MAKASYLIRVINKGREKDYFDFWRRNSKVNADGESLNAELVGFEVTQSGNDADDAIASVRRKHAGLQIDTQSVRIDETV